MSKENPSGRYALLEQFLPLLAEFEASTPATGPEALAAFLAWLPTRRPSPPPAPSDADPSRSLRLSLVPDLLLTPAPDYANARVAPNRHETLESLLVKLVTFLYRYVRGYTRLALADTPLVTFDDFTYLITLFAEGPHSKSDLIARNIQEKATGTEIIKRLLRQALVSDGPHATDRRRRVLHLTPTGQALLFRILPRMEQVARLSVGNLSPAEHHQLVQLLHKLDAFHHPIFSAPKTGDFDAFVQKHLPDSP